MKKRLKERKRIRFKREYFPVFIAFVILIILLTGLYFAFKIDTNVGIEGSSTTVVNRINEFNVTINNSNISKSDLSTLKKSANNVIVEYDFKNVLTGRWPDEKFDTYTLPEGTIYYNPNDEPEKFRDYLIEGEYDTRDIVSMILYINIKNIDENIYVEVVDDINEINQTIYSNSKYKDLMTSYIEDKRTVTINIYSNQDSSKGTLLRSLSFSPPFYNIFSEFKECDTNKAAKVCSTFIEESISYEDFLKGIEDNKGNENEGPEVDEDNPFGFYKYVSGGNESERIEQEEKQNRFVFISIIAFIIVSISIIFIIIFRRNKK